MVNDSPISERALRVGQRMRAAAIDAGYTTSTAMAEAMGMRQSSISRYWHGRREPSGDRMALYAQLTDRRVSWFYETADDYEQERLK